MLFIINKIGNTKEIQNYLFKKTVIKTVSANKK